MDEEVEEGSERGHSMEREESGIIAMERNEKEDLEERRGNTETTKQR